MHLVSGDVSVVLPHEHLAPKQGLKATVCDEELVMTCLSLGHCLQAARFSS